MNKLTKIVSQYFTDFTEEETSDPKNYFRNEIQLPDGGHVSVGLEGKTRNCVEFLHFNIRNSNIRLTDSNVYNGKINVFGENCIPKLHEYLAELKTRLRVDALMPPAGAYSSNVQIAMIRFGMTSDEARDKYGMYTIGEWNELLNK